jgi:GTP cyclohydrolase I
MSTPDGLHYVQLSDTLHKLKSQQDNPDQVSTTQKQSKTPNSRDGYGFRKSGISTPQISDQLSQSDGLPLSQLISNPLPDPNGLGWPGSHPPVNFCLQSMGRFSSHN